MVTEPFGEVLRRAAAMFEQQTMPQSGPSPITPQTFILTFAAHWLILPV
jgi:hypothetical protein